MDDPTCLVSHRVGRSPGPCLPLKPPLGASNCATNGPHHPAGDDGGRQHTRHALNEPEKMPLCDAATALTTAAVWRSQRIL
ncbi:hypothetical protein MRX96_045366 [Rhipicephalus microplus]